MVKRKNPELVTSGLDNEKNNHAGEAAAKAILPFLVEKPKSAQPKPETKNRAVLL